MDTRCIEENELASFNIFNSANAVTCGLRFISDDGNLFTEDAVKKGGFSNIWPSQDGDETTFERSHSYLNEVWSLEFGVQSL